MAEAIVKWIGEDDQEQEETCPYLKLALAEAKHHPGARVVSERTEYWYDENGRLQYRHMKWWERF